MKDEDERVTKMLVWMPTWEGKIATFDSRDFGEVNKGRKEGKKPTLALRIKPQRSECRFH